MSSSIKIPKKLIEVALPLDDINKASAYEKLPGIGPHPRGIHHWWARRPFAAARAIIFAQMVNDPGFQVGEGFRRGVNKKDAEKKREELFDVVRGLADWKRSEDKQLLKKAKELIKASWLETCALNKNKEEFNPDILPEFHDPFAGGGALPLEALRLGLKSNASDLNPIPVIINHAMLDIPNRFIDLPPVGPDNNKQKSLENWSGIQGLAEDIRRYGNVVNEQAKQRLSDVYPDVDGKKVVAWIWARTVESPNPAFAGCHVPLVKSFILKSKKGEATFVQPVIDAENKTYSFEVIKSKSKPKIGGTIGRKGGICLLSGSPIPLKYIREQGIKGNLGLKLLAIVTEGKSGKDYISPIDQHEKIALSIKPKDFPSCEIEHWAGCTNSVVYGLTNFEHLFTGRQLQALCLYSDLIQAITEIVKSDCIKAGINDDGVALHKGGSGATAYAEAITVYLSFSLSRATDFNNSLSGWNSSNEKVMHLFGRQAIPMVWDFGEANILEKVVGGFPLNVEYQSKCIEKIPVGVFGKSLQLDASMKGVKNAVISTDPPYYDNVPYSNISDFFYIWLRRTIKNIYPDIFSTISVPKFSELVANQFRHGDKEAAEKFFLDGMQKTMHLMVSNAHPAFPITIYYAFKQSDTLEYGTSSTGWETFLEAVISAGFSITGTWPMRSEQETRMRSMRSNALASSIVLVCRKRERDAETISRRQFQKELRESMPESLETMIGGLEGSTPIAPVDLAQAAIGPGMGIFSKYNAVLNQDGSPMNVHDALILINREITDYLNPDSGNFDNETLFCSSWFDQYGWNAGPFGEADTLSRAKGTIVDGVKNAGVIESGGGKVKLLKWENYPDDWDPKTDHRMPIWEACHQMIRTLNRKGESEAGILLARMPEKGEHIRQLAYHLYTLCERKKWAEEARAYNELITSWHGIVSSSHEVGHRGTQNELFN